MGGEETIGCIVSVRRDGGFGKSGGLGHRRAVAHGVVGVGVVLARRACRERSRTVVGGGETVQRVVGVGDTALLGCGDNRRQRNDFAFRAACVRNREAHGVDARSAVPVSGML